MATQSLDLRLIFSTLSDSRHRVIIRRLYKKPLAVSDIAKSRGFSKPVVEKHLQVLEKARLVVKRKVGAKFFVELNASAMKRARAFLDNYENFWDELLELSY